MLTEMTADAVRPVRTERLAVMNLYWYQNEMSRKTIRKYSYISVFLLSSPVVLFKTLVMTIMTISVLVQASNEH